LDNVFSFIDIMPRRVKLILKSLDEEILKSITEIRIRKRKPLIIYLGNDLFFISSISNTLTEKYTASSFIVDEESFNIIIDRICNNSYHTKMNSMIKGYITYSNGSRVGIGASAVYQGGEISLINDISSLNIRVSHDAEGFDDKIMTLIDNNYLPNIIVAGAPSSGKTTLLREISKSISSGKKGLYKKVIVIDERGELTSGFETGVNSDVLKFYNKCDGIEIATRTLSPDYIICDEIGNINEANSVKKAFFSGVRFILSIHLSSLDERDRNEIYRSLICSNQFDLLLFIDRKTRNYEIIKLKDRKNENNRKCIDSIINDTYFIKNIGIYEERN